MQVRELASHKLIACFSKACDGNMSLTYGDTRDALKNRTAFLKGSGVELENLVFAQQAHSDHIRYVADSDKGAGAYDHAKAIPDTDAFVSDKKGIALAILTADCLPVFLYDPKKEIIGIVHAGSKGTQQKITTKTISFLKERFNCLPEDIKAAFGPGIRSCCHEVNSQKDGFLASQIRERAGKCYVDLGALNKSELLASGLSELNIYDPGLCTFCKDQDYFSFRREKEKAGRMISVIILK